MPEAVPHAPYAIAENVLAVIRDQNRGKLRRDPVGRDQLVERYGMRPNHASYTLNALRFLGLLDGAGKRTARFNSYYAPHIDWRVMLADDVRHAYALIFPHINPDQVPASVYEAFKLYEPRGMRRQMVALFLGLVRAAGISLRAEANQARQLPRTEATADERLPDADTDTTPLNEAMLKPPAPPKHEPPVPQPTGDDATVPGPITIVADSVQVRPSRMRPRHNELPSPAATSAWQPGAVEIGAGDVRSLAVAFEAACAEYGVRVTPAPASSAVIGPQVVRLYFELARGQRLVPLRTVLPEVGLRLRRGGLLVQPIPERGIIALDVPRPQPEIVAWAEGLRSLPLTSSIEQMPIAVGVTPEGEHIIAWLDEMPHLLVGGTTGSGKTVFLYTLIASLLAHHRRPEELRLLVSTSKLEDFSQLARLPHLLGGGVISEAHEAIAAIENIGGSEFEHRGRLLVEAGRRDIGEYNRGAASPLPPIVVVVDEFADLADQLSGRAQAAARAEFYAGIRRIAQLGRSRGVHLVLATQRPSADLLPTNIRSLLNSRVALRVNDVTASTMILDEAGAESLMRRGDLLFKHDGKTARVQGYFISADDIIGRK